jgi:predicted enzyme related to lactoylglutathione lyase
MRTRGLSRVVIGVKNLDEAVERYSRLLGTTFSMIPREATERFGSLAAVSWDAQLELVARIPGVEGRGLLTKQDGFMGIIYNCDDVEAARAISAEMGGEVVASIVMNQEQIDRHLEGRFSHFVEYAINPKLTDGVPSAIAQITNK